MWVRNVITRATGKKERGEGLNTMHGGPQNHSHRLVDSAAFQLQSKLVHSTLLRLTEAVLA